MTFGVIASAKKATCSGETKFLGISKGGSSRIVLQIRELPNTKLENCMHQFKHANSAFLDTKFHPKSPKNLKFQSDKSQSF
jgi:hypothetical protein